MGGVLEVCDGGCAGGVCWRCVMGGVLEVCDGVCAGGV